MEFLSRHVTLVLVGLPLFVFFGMLVLFAIGRYLGLRRLARDPEATESGLGPVRGAIFGLLGLLIAFTFAGAAGRYDKRRDQVMQEAVAFDNVLDRLAALPPETRRPVRDGLRRYIEARLAAYRRVPDLDAVLEELRRAGVIRDEVWREAIAACKAQPDQRLTMLVLPALEAAFDKSRVRTAIAFHHPPMVIWVMLVVLSLVCALIAGYGVTSASRRYWIYMVAFAASTTIAVYATLDIEFPRAGMVRVDAADRALTEVVERMK